MKQFTNWRFSNHNVNKFIFMLQKHKCIGDQEKLPEKEDFYSHLNVEDINNADYKHEKMSL